MKHDSKSIQQLRNAEKRMEEKINQARKRKILKFKQAKIDAQAEVENFRAAKEKAFIDHEANCLGSQEDIILKIERDTERSLKEMEKCVELNKDAIIDYLLKQVFTIECEMHENFRKDAL